MAKCLIAGLPSAGKTTYIAALSYLLHNPISEQMLRFNILPDDISLINRLQQPWLEQKIVDRTSRGKVTDLQFNLERISDQKVVNVNIPDIAGEDFTSILEKQCETINSWNEKPDSLLFFIKKVPTLVLTESFNDIENAPSAKTKAPNFTIQHIYEGTQNVLLIKELRRLFPWKRIAIGLTSWDLHNSEEKPCEYLRNECPFLSNFINQYFPEAYIFGVSAQGWEYNEKMDIDDCMNKTMEGKRSYIIDPNGKKSYDITLPLDYLIS